MYFSIKNSRLIISSKILGGNNNFKIIGFPTLNNKLTLVNDNIFKIKDIYWQINIDNIWKSVHKGNKYITNKEYIGNELRVLISYFDNNNFLDNIIIPYFSISSNNVYTLPNAKLNKKYFFKFSLENNEKIFLKSDWLNFNIKNEMIILYGEPNDLNLVNFHIMKNDNILKYFRLYIDNDKKTENILLMKKDNEDIIVDNLYYYNLKTNDMFKNISFEIINFPKWLNFINNNDGSAIISGVPNINNIGQNKVSLIIFSNNIKEKLEYFIKVLPDKELPVLKELKKISKVTKSENIYYCFSSSKYGTIIYEGNIYSESKKAKIGFNKILLKTDIDGIYSGSIKVKDSNRNISLPLYVNSFKVDRIKPKLVSVNIESSGKNLNYAKLNDIIKLKFKSDKEINVTSLLILDQLVDVNKINKFIFEANYKLNKEILSKKVNFKINFEDYLKTKGDEISVVTNNSFVIIDMIKPKLKSVKINSSNEDKFLAKIDDIISIEIISDKVIDNINIEFFGEFVNIIKVDDFNFIGKYSILGDININNSMLKIEYDDLAGNKGDIITDTTDNSYIEILQK
tara:strand:+ start:1583 stop:3292 length:1710 start_codon:yes stop_codon:yes gene_type:complete